MAKAYSYIRMSTPEQLKGDSVRRQQKATNDYVAEMGLELTDIIRDHGISAFKGKNAEFGELSEFLHLASLGMIEIGSFLIVESLDRLTRQNVFEAISLLNRIIQYGINVVTLIDRRIYSKESLAKNEADLMIASITMMRAHEESRTKSVRISAVWQNKRNQAKNGLIIRQKIPSWLKYSDDGKSYEVIEERAKIIREIFELSRDGWGAYSIAKLINERGMVSWGKSTMWQESYIKKILTNRSLLGEYQPHKVFNENQITKRVADGDVLLNYFPVIVDELLFSEARDSALKRRSSGKRRKGSNFPNLFSGILRCAGCKSGIRYMDKGAAPKGGRYLRCSKSILTRQCSAVSMHYDEIENILVNIIKDINFDMAVNGYEFEHELVLKKSKKIKNIKEVENIGIQINRIIDAIASLSESVELQLKLRNLTEYRQLLIDSNSELDFEISELSSFSTSNRSELLKKLNDETLSTEEKVLLRKKVSAEIKRFIKIIKLNPITKYEWEYEVQDGPRIDGVEIVVEYRNGNWQHFDSTERQETFSKINSRFKILREKSKIDSLE